MALTNKRRTRDFSVISEQNIVNTIPAFNLIALIKTYLSTLCNMSILFYS